MRHSPFLRPASCRPCNNGALLPPTQTFSSFRSHQLSCYHGKHGWPLILPTFRFILSASPILLADFPKISFSCSVLTAHFVDNRSGGILPSSTTIVTGGRWMQDIEIAIHLVFVLRRCDLHRTHQQPMLHGDRLVSNSFNVCKNVCCRTRRIRSVILYWRYR